MYYEAETCVQAGDLDGAIEICTNIQEEKADADALFLRGRAYFLQKNYEQAKVDLMRQWRRRRAISSALTLRAVSGEQHEGGRRPLPRSGSED